MAGITSTGLGSGLDIKSLVPKAGRGMLPRPKRFAPAYMLALNSGWH